jgi:hypothetical protein
MSSDDLSSNLVNVKYETGGKHGRLIGLTNLRIISFMFYSKLKLTDTQMFC